MPDEASAEEICRPDRARDSGRRDHEEENSRIYMTFAEDLQERYPASAKVFEEMAEEEQGHRRRLLDLYQERFGPHLPRSGGKT